MERFLDSLVHEPTLILDWDSVDRSRDAVRTAGPRPERRVCLCSPWVVRDRPSQNDSASLFGSQPRCFLDGHTAAKALIRGRQVFQLHQSRWCRGVRIRNPRTRFPGVPCAVRVLSPLKFFLARCRRVYDGRGRVVLLECAFDGGEVRLFHGVNDLDISGIARYVRAHLWPYVGLNSRTAIVPNPQ